jgi:hypothetical protein
MLWLLPLLLLLPRAARVGAPPPRDVPTARRVRLAIPTVRYAHLLNRSGRFGLPRLNVSRVDYSDVVSVVHEAVVLENACLRVTVLPRMGRVYRVEDKTTGHDVLWRNRIAAPAGANNDLGWWLWIGGIEYTLPGQEHGFTWALDWDWRVDDAASAAAAAVTAVVVEPTTGMVETLTFSLAPDSIALDTTVHLHNPSATRTAMYAHWTNVPFVPGPSNRLPDGAEFIVPTASISVEPRWQANLGPGTQDWPASPLRYFANWTNGTRMGDFTANGFSNLSGTPSSFFGTFSHDDDEGGVRVFDAEATPGLDTWTYGFEPTDRCFPQNRQISRCSYAEMWGGTVRQLEKLKPLAPRANLSWSEHVAPFRGTQGLAFANKYFGANAYYEDQALTIAVTVSPIRALPNVEIVLGNRSQPVLLFYPGHAIRAEFPVDEGGVDLGENVVAVAVDNVVITVKSSGVVVGSFPLPRRKRKKALSMTHD